MVREASLRVLPGSATRWVLEAWPISGSPTGGCPASSRVSWLLHMPAAPSNAGGLGVPLFFRFGLAGALRPARIHLDPFSLTRLNHLEISWLSLPRVFWMQEWGGNWQPQKGGVRTRTGSASGLRPSGQRGAPADGLAGRRQSRAAPGGSGALPLLPPARVSAEPEPSGARPPLFRRKRSRGAEPGCGPGRSRQPRQLPRGRLRRGNRCEAPTEGRRRHFRPALLPAGCGG